MNIPKPKRVNLDFSALRSLHNYDKPTVSLVEVLPEQVRASRNLDLWLFLEKARYVLKEEGPAGAGQAGDHLGAVALGIDARVQNGHHPPVGLAADEPAHALLQG
jgi:hypothetical protein